MFSFSTMKQTNMSDLASWLRQTESGYSWRSYLTLTIIGLAHSSCAVLVLAFGYFQLHVPGSFLEIRYGIERYVTHDGKKKFYSFLPELLICPSLSLGVILICAYAYILMQQCLHQGYLVSFPWRYIRFSTRTTFLHAAFILFYVIGVAFTYLASLHEFMPQDYFGWTTHLILMIVGLVIHAGWIIGISLLFPPFLTFRRRMIEAEKLLNQKLWLAGDHEHGM